jgi:hypothetical protein
VVFPHAVNAQRHEVLSQFWENHFVTQYSKSRDYLDNNQGYDATPAESSPPTGYREMKWRNAMLNPHVLRPVAHAPKARR